MAMNNQLLAVVQHIENERGVSREIVLTAIEQAISQAARKNQSVTNDLRVSIDPFVNGGTGAKYRALAAKRFAEWGGVR